MRLIDADALLNECAECQKTDPHFEGRGWASHFINVAGEPSTEWYCVEDMIENAPTIDAEPVRHGIWVEDDEGGGNVCGLCRWYVYEGDRDNYCPHCGAKMDGEE